VLTAHVDAIDFRAPVPIGAFIEAIARVVAVGRTSMTVEVVLEAEDRHTAARMVTTTGASSWWQSTRRDARASSVRQAPRRPTRRAFRAASRHGRPIHVRTDGLLGCR